ncbi:Os08g0255750 [Oryza sativa Japonica Group]|uniref:Os08g0255750 protein n=1 Tax=Oryza sativa subsp. japonica TaxID=39947 RepID=A0A0P0XE49_ORYSJ|nr:Os08g0255750 [Oryza sativa Japonica Group]
MRAWCCHQLREVVLHYHCDALRAMVEVLVEEEAPPMCKKEAMAAIVEGLPGRDECDLETLVVVVVLVVVEPVVAAVAARAAAGYESGQGVVPKDRLGASRERTCCGGALVATGAAVRARTAKLQN